MNPTEETRMTRTPAPALPLLDELDELRAKATRGPWEVLNCGVDGTAVMQPEGHSETPVIAVDFGVVRGEDAALIVAAVNAVPQLTAALRAVLELAQDGRPGLYVAATDITTALEAS